jgi:hypothetical protein
LYVVVHDIPMKTAGKPVMLHHAVLSMSMIRLGKDEKSSTNACYLTEDGELAKKFLEVVQKFNGKGNLHKAVKIQ